MNVRVHPADLGCRGGVGPGWRRPRPAGEPGRGRRLAARRSGRRAPRARGGAGRPGLDHAEIDRPGPARPGRRDHPDRHGQEHHRPAAVPAARRSSGATRRRSPTGRASTRPWSRSPTTRSAPARSRSSRSSYTEADPNLDPGETADFTLTARVADLELAPTDGVYLMGVHVLQAGNVFAVGRARVFVPLVAEDVPRAAPAQHAGGALLPAVPGPRGSALRRPPGSRDRPEGPADPAAQGRRPSGHQLRRSTRR